MSVQPLIIPKFRYLDTSGNPLAGGKLYTYSAGTTTPLSTYTTRAGNVANTNPVILDANGEADVWTTPGVDYKFVLKTSADVTLWTVDNYPSPVAADTTASVAAEPGGRLTLTTGTPVTTGDVTGAGTAYYTPYKHNRIPVWNGTEWVLETFTELSQTTTDTTKSPAAVANNSNYDLFVWNDSGTIRLSRGPPWTSDTARGTGAGTTEVARLNGRFVNAVSITNGPAANRGTYVGTVRSDGSAQLSDSLEKRHVWNAYSRKRRALTRLEPTNNWSYNTATWRQAMASASNQVSVVCGLSEDAVGLHLLAMARISTAASDVFAGIGLDSTTAIATGCLTADNELSSSGVTSCIRAQWSGVPGLGYHYLAWLERGDGGGGTVAWQGDTGNPDRNQCGLSGECLA